MIEQLFTHVVGKVVVVILLAIAGIIVVIFRKIITAINKKTNHSTIEAMRRNPSLASEMIASLDIPYTTKKDFPSSHFDKLKYYLATIKKVGNFSILETSTYNAHEFLVFTELTYGDYDVSYLGQPTNITKKAYHQFVLRHDNSNNTMIVLSNIYTDSSSKFQKEGFIDAIFKGAIV